MPSTLAPGALTALSSACTTRGPLSDLAVEGLVELLTRLDGPTRARVLATTGGQTPVLTYRGKGCTPPAAAVELVDTHGHALSWAGSVLNDGLLLLGDNLDVMRSLHTAVGDGHIVNGDGSRGVRVIYMDPPFSTGRDFLFSDGTHAYCDKLTGAAFAEFLRQRLVAARDLLTDDGSLYLHLDAHAVHHAKLLADEVFGERCFRGEIIWKRSTAKGSASRTYGAMHDSILFYSRRPTGWLWNRQYTPYSSEHLAKFYRHDDGDGRGPYGLDNLQKPEAGRGYMYTWDGYAPPPKGWYVTEATMARLDAEGRLHKPADQSKRLRLKRYLSEAKGVPLQDVWDDLPPVQRPRYPTQKPLRLLERILSVSSNPGDVILDPFNGAGTTLEAALSLGRRPIAADLSTDAVRTTLAHLPGLHVGAVAGLAGVANSVLVAA